MKTIALPVLALMLAACGSPLPTAPLSAPDAVADTSINARLGSPSLARDLHSSAITLDAYKVDLAQRIAQINAAKVYSGRPQALLRSVIVLRYTLDSHGNLVRSEILRSNRDATTEATALASLKTAAPFPKPARHLLRNGRIDVSESWLFNSDGRFQLRSIAQAQMTE
ncbi:MAG: hypothetical protein JWP36_2747 [Paucimonas sp.]|nr:hypothetical protein [Paucimonas sp.]